MSDSQIKLEFKDTDINVEDSLIQAFHNFKTGDYVRFNVIGGDSPTIILNNKTELLTDEYFYYIGVINSNSFELYSSLDAAYSQFPATSIQFNSAGSGNFSFTKQKRSFSSKISVIPIFSSVRKSFSDFFQRNNTEGGLGITPDGSRWDNVRGVFRVLFNKAVSETSPSEYPMATVTMPFEEVEISLKDIDSGVGAALWVTDSGNWWGIGLQQEEVDCNCSQGTQCDRWNSQNCRTWNRSNCRAWRCSSWSGSSSNPGFNTGQCTSWSSGNCQLSFNPCVSWFVFGINQWRCNAWGSRRCGRWNAGVCRTRRWNATTWNANTCTGNSCSSFNSTNCTNWNSQTCNRWFEFTFDCETCYPQYIRIFQSISSTVTTVFSAVVTKTFQAVSSTYGSLNLFVQSDTSAPTAKSMKVATENGTISADVFSDTEFNDKIIVEEEIIYSPTGAQISTTYGIIVNPSSYNQNNFIGEINIDKI